MVPMPGKKMFRQRQKLAIPGVILLIAEIGQHIMIKTRFVNVGKGM